MTTRDELAVLPPAEPLDPEGLRILNRYLHAWWVDPSEHAVVFVLWMPAPSGPPKLVGLDGEEHVLPARCSRCCVKSYRRWQRAKRSRSRRFTNSSPPKRSPISCGSGVRR